MVEPRSHRLQTIATYIYKKSIQINIDISISEWEFYYFVIFYSACSVCTKHHWPIPLKMVWRYFRAFNLISIFHNFNQLSIKQSFFSFELLLAATLGKNRKKNREIPKKWFSCQNSINCQFKMMIILLWHWKGHVLSINMASWKQTVNETNSSR